MGAGFIATACCHLSLFFLANQPTNLEKILNHPTAVIYDSSHEWGVAIPISNLHIYSEHIAT
jgi:hypothetical protein